MGKVNQISESQQTPHTSPLQVSYRVSIVRILEKIDQIIIALHCTHIHPNVPSKHFFPFTILVEEE